MIKSPSSSSQDILDEFILRFTKQAGAIYQTKDPQELTSTVNRLIKDRGRGESCCFERIELSYDGARLNISPVIETTFPFEAFRKNPRESAGVLDVGITKADYGIAETGSIVDVSYSDEQRLLSSISRVHIAVLEKSDLLGKLSMLSKTMKDLLGRNNVNRPSISIIGGPSRTSDIELKSVLGVHGPHEVHVVLI